MSHIVQRSDARYVARCYSCMREILQVYPGKKSNEGYIVVVKVVGHGAWTAPLPPRRLPSLRPPSRSSAECTSHPLPVPLYPHIPAYGCCRTGRAPAILHRQTAVDISGYHKTIITSFVAEVFIMRRHLVVLLASISSTAQALGEHRLRFRVTPRAGPISLVGASDVLEAARRDLQPAFAAIDDHTEITLRRVLTAFRKHGVSAHHFAGVDGYGHGDLGREVLDEVYADLMGAEAAWARVQCFSGTHAITCALFAALRPGDELLGVSGAPYDTLEEVIGLRGRTEDGLRGTLADFGVTYRQVELKADGSFDLEAISASLRSETRMVHVQRSCGYAWRPSIPIAEIGRLADWLREHRPGVILFVDVRLRRTVLAARLPSMAPRTTFPGFVASSLDASACEPPERLLRRTLRRTVMASLWKIASPAPWARTLSRALSSKTLVARWRQPEATWQEPQSLLPPLLVD